VQDKQSETAVFDFPVVAVGASAGGIEALKALAELIPAETRAAFVILQHLAPDHESQLVNILARAAQLPCRQADENMVVEAGHIYVLPPDRYLSLLDQGLFVQPPLERRGSRMPIDYFMRSLAEAAGAQAVGVVLSGTGSDGSLGLRAIRGAGGITFAQSPETALYDGMPRSAINAGDADQVGTIGEICNAIARLAEDIPKRATEDFTRRDLEPLLALLKARMSFDFAGYKIGTIGRRVKRRMSLMHLSTLSEYMQALQQDANELSALFDDMLINVTAFFRDERVWPEVRKKVIEPLLANAAGQPLRIWVPACASGEEAYSLAIVLDECCRQGSIDCDWQIFASDLDAQAIARGREALYPQSILADVGEQRLQRYFRKEVAGFRVEKELRERVVFAQQDILSDPPFSRLDLVSCRNLMIYLTPAYQDRLIDTFHFALKESGYLLLGTSETVTARTREFETVSSKAHIYQRRPGPAAAEFASRECRDNKPEMPGKPENSRRERTRDLTELVRQSMLDRYAPAGAVIDARGSIRHYVGPVQRFMETPEGEPTNNLFDVIPQSLQARVRGSIRRVASGGNGEQPPVLVRFSDRDRTVKVDCVAIGSDAKNPQYLVTFLQVEQARPPARNAQNSSQEYIQRLEDELEIVREDLQTTVEELEASNEELKAKHEEALAANEELQSANEELETSREELQSLNEELVTVNHQLEDKIEEVEKTTDDLSNLLTSTRLPVLFLDPDLNISSYTPTMHGLIELREGDIGRPLAELAFKIDDQALVEDARSVLHDLHPVEVQVAGPDATIFLRRIQPYRTGDERIGGVVVTFTNVTEQANTAQRLAVRERQARIIAELAHAALAHRDPLQFMEDASNSLRQAMACGYCKVLRLNQRGDTFSLLAGSGWNEGLVGTAQVENGRKSQAGYTLQIDHAVLVNDLAQETRFDGPPLLLDHGVRSGISTKITVGGKPWGVIGLHDREPGHFGEEDLNILRIVADIISLAVMQARREEHLARERLSLSLALKAAHLGVWTYDVESGSVTWDEQLREMIDLQGSHANPQITDFLQHVHADDRARVEAALQSTAETGDPFDTEFRFVRPDGGIVWLMGKAARLGQQGRRMLIGVNADITERRLSDEQTSFMMRELDHRVKNLFAIILSIAELTSRSSDDLPTFRKAFSSRLHAMARTHTTLAESRWIGADLKTLLEEEVAGHGSTGQVTLSGPRVSITPACAQALSMLFHEMMTNAVKYGALSTTKGQIVVRWMLKPEGTTLLNLVWQETGGPLVRPPQTTGFGSKVMERIVTDQLSADVETNWSSAGLCFNMTFDIAPFIPGATGASEPPRDRADRANPAPDSVQDKTILVIDDEWLAAEQHADILTSMGAKVLGPFTKLDDAMAVDLASVDAALLDFSLDEGDSLPLARKLHKAGKPFAFVTGYGAAMSLPAPFESCPVITKPANAASILDGTARLLAERTRA